MASVLKAVLTLSAVYHRLPKAHGNPQAFRNQLDRVTGPGFGPSHLLHIMTVMKIVVLCGFGGFVATNYSEIGCCGAVEGSLCVDVATGVSLRRQVRDAALEVLDGLVQLLEVLLSSPLQRFVSSPT